MLKTLLPLGVLRLYRTDTTGYCHVIKLWAEGSNGEHSLTLYAEGLDIRKRSSVRCIPKAVRDSNWVLHQSLEIMERECQNREIGN